MSAQMSQGHVEILLVEDNPGDVRLTQEALRERSTYARLNVVEDGEQAIAFLRRTGCYADAPHPDLVLLDLNLPKKSGYEVLAEIKRDKDLRRIPVVILTTSHAREDILATYAQHANCYITKPSDLEQYFAVVEAIDHFWLRTVCLPPE